MKTYITPQGYARLRAEFEQLKHVERPHIVEEVYCAACQGDRSENASYTYNKQRLREIDRRLRFLNRQFKSMEVVDPAQRKERPGVFFGATVTVLDLNTDEERRYQIVGPLDELDDAHISYQSPIGRALLGKQLDDELIIKSPNGAKELVILEIEY